MSVPTTIHRTDPLPVFANAGKAQAVRRLLDAWRDACPFHFMTRSLFTMARSPFSR